MSDDRVEIPTLPEQEEIENQIYYRVKIIHSSETEVCTSPLPESLKRGDKVIVPSRYGKDLGIILGETHFIEDTPPEEIIQVLRIATENDLVTFDGNKAKEQDALEVCKEKVRLHNLDMKLVSAHYLLDEPKILFFFTADARVDFRELVKDLVAIFKMRIELRQIGVRDESRVIGGVAVCSRTYCCHGLTDKLRPVSIKMAKEQNLSLNSMKISGPCGRLLCCLSYEYDFYKEEKRRFPPEGTRIQWEEITYKVTEINVLSNKVHLTASDGRSQDLPLVKFSFDDKEGIWKII